MSSEAGAPPKLTVPNSLTTTTVALIGLGVLAFIVGLIQDQERTWHAYLIGLFYFTSLALGGLFFSAIQHMVKAGWSVNIRRLTESFTGFLPYAFVLSLIFLVGSPEVYSWLQPDVVAKDPLIQHKTPYLNFPFYIVRIVAFFSIWMLFSRVIVGRSLKQDESGDEKITPSLLKWSVIFMLVFSVTYSFFSVDTLMSLEPHWFSTIFGVYTFAGLFQTTMALTILLAVWLIKKGHLKNHVNENHLHDLGKFLFAFTVFWAYIAFSQYMLIWYANIPEETLFFKPRQKGGWVFVSMSLLIFKFIVPFIALLPRSAKRNGTYLSVVSVLILVMQVVDLYWLVYPNLSEKHLIFGLYELFIFMGFAGLFGFVTFRFLSRHPLIPIKDPRRGESEHHHVTY